MNDDRRRLAGEEYLEQLRRSHRNYRDADYFPEKLPDFKAADSPIELMAYYLPQFHPIPENDEWWGKGFTEWTSVARARPQFVGHYQPHLPSDLGFYDLRNEDTMKQQIELAKGYCLSGFIFYYYWFDGRRVLERPLDTFLKRKDFDFKFSLCWASENWTRRWDGDEHEVLLKQTHSPENDRAFIQDIAEFLRDPRYIRVDGRPFLSIYRIGLLSGIEDTVRRWRAAAREILGEDLFLVYAMTFGEARDPLSIGFDAAMQFPPHGIPTDWITGRLQPFSEDYSGHVWAYEPLPKNARKFFKTVNFPLIPAVFPSWDNTARRGEHAHVYFRSSPDVYAKWLAEVANYAYSHPVHGRSLVVINAWNEWAEGAHLEPDQKFGHAFLRATADILRPYLKADCATMPPHPLMPTAMVESPVESTGQATATIIHAHYVEPLIDILSHIPDFMQSSVFITLSPESDPEILATISHWGRDTNLLFFPNRGRDIRPFLGALRVVKSLRYRYFVKLHTKRSVHRADGTSWSDELTQPLLSGLRDGSIERYLDDSAEVSLVGPANHLLDGFHFMGSAANFHWLRRLCSHLGLRFPQAEFSFIAGSMFAGRIEPMAPLMDDPWIGSMFEEELGRSDGTLAHALERMFGLICSLNGTVIAELEFRDGQARFSRSRPKTSNYQYAEMQPWQQAD